MKNKYLNFNKILIKNIYDKKLIYPIIFLISLIIPWIILMQKGELITLDSSVYKVLLFLLITIDVNFIILNLILRDFKIEHIYLSLMLPIGLCYLTFIIPNFIPDEAAHSYRAYTIAEGHILTDRTEKNTAQLVVPRALLNTLSEVNTYKQLVSSMKEKTDYNDTVVVGGDGTGAAGYPVIGYVFSSVGMKIGKTFNINIILTYYIARLLTFMLSIFIIFKAIQLIPIGKIVMLVYSFSPMLIQQSISVSADNIINALSLFLVAFCLHKLFDKKDLTNKEYALVCVVIISFSILKYAYFPYSLILLTLLKKDSKQNNMKIFALILASIVIALGTYYFTSHYYANALSYVVNNGIDSNAQISYIISHPFSYVKTIVNTLELKSDFYFFTMLGRNLGPFTINVNEFIIIIFYSLLLLSPFLEKNEYELKKSDMLIYASAFVIIFLLIETGLYIGWTGVGADVVEGIHGRYFLPIAIILPILFIRKKNELKFNYRLLFICSIILLVNVSCIRIILKFFNY